jgi:hypothetical protein
MPRRSPNEDDYEYDEEEYEDRRGPRKFKKDEKQYDNRRKREQEYDRNNGRDEHR